MRLVCIVDETPEESSRLLREACERRGITFEEIESPLFDYAEARRLAPGDLLIRPSASQASIFVEQFLFADGVATFHRDSAHVYVDTPAPRLMLERAGVPVPFTIYCATSNRDVLDGYIERLGGFPIVASLGGEGGRGTLRLDSRASFYSTLDFCTDHGLVAALSGFLPAAMHWRVVVVGRRAVACYTNPVKPDDFRSRPSTDPADYSAVVDPALANMAVAAAAALGVEFAGVDILRVPGRGDFVLEANTPCYFPKAQLMAGIDVAGAMVDALVEKSKQGGTVACSVR